MKKLNQHKRKYGVWLRNHTSRQDDEWIYVWAKDANDAYNAARGKFDHFRFSLHDASPVKEFRRQWGV